MASDEGRWDLDFVDGPPEGPFDLVVGTDGARSKVRKVLSDTVPFYSGITGVELKFKVYVFGCKIQKYCGFCALWSFLGLGRLPVQRHGNDSIQNYVVMRTPETWIKGCRIDFSGEKAEGGLWSSTSLIGLENFRIR